MSTKQWNEEFDSTKKLLFSSINNDEKTYKQKSLLVSDSNAEEKYTTYWDKHKSSIEQLDNKDAFNFIVKLYDKCQSYFKTMSEVPEDKTGEFLNILYPSFYSLLKVSAMHRHVLNSNIKDIIYQFADLMILWNKSHGSSTRAKEITKLAKKI